MKSPPTSKNNTGYAAHINHAHINPLKHGLVKRVADWPYSSFHHWVKMGVWAGDGRVKIEPYGR